MMYGGLYQHTQVVLYIYNIATTSVSFSVEDLCWLFSRWLTVKNWLIHKKRKIELAPKRTWKKYWVCLKGTMLLFIQCDEQGNFEENSVPRHILGMASYVLSDPVIQNLRDNPKLLTIKVKSNS